MPLTLSHPALVLPLRRAGLPLTVLVIASMIPDVPLFLGSVRGYDVTHSLVGIVTLDVVLVVGAAAWWSFVMRDALTDLAPCLVRSRLLARVRPSRRDWLLTPAAAVVGAASHVAWDSFTHPGQWGVRRIEWLQSEHAGLAGLKWAQYTSGVVGLVIVVTAAAALTGLVSAAPSVSSGLHAMAFHGVVDSLVVLAVGLFLVTVAWHVAGMSRRPGRLHAT
jgi:hypothetical protein